MSPPFPLPIGFFSSAAGGGGASIVTSDLALHLDAAEAASYGGSGTTWSDLTSNNYDFTFASAPSYTASPGFFNFASNQATNSDTISITRGAVEVWFRWDAGSSSSIPIVTSTGGWFAMGNATSALPSESIEFNTGVAAVMNYSNGHLFFEDSTWHQFVGVIDGSANVIYVDGAAVATTFRSGGATSTGLTTGSSHRIGTSAGTYNWDGDISIVRIYDVASFSAADVLQNWNAQKARHGR